MPHSVITIKDKVRLFLKGNMIVFPVTLLQQVGAVNMRQRGGEFVCLGITWLLTAIKEAGILLRLTLLKPFILN